MRKRHGGQGDRRRVKAQCEELEVLGEDVVTPGCCGPEAWQGGWRWALRRHGSHY